MLVSVCRLQWIQTSLNTVQFCYRSIQQSTITVKYPCVGLQIGQCFPDMRRYDKNVFFYRKRGHCVQYIAILGYQTLSKMLSSKFDAAASRCSWMSNFLCMFRALFRRTVFIKSSKAYCLSAFDLLSFHIPLICASIYQLQNDTSTFPKIRAKRKNFL